MAGEGEIVFRGTVGRWMGQGDRREVYVKRELKREREGRRSKGKTWKMFRSADRCNPSCCSALLLLWGYTLKYGAANVCSIIKILLINKCPHFVTFVCFKVLNI